MNRMLNLVGRCVHLHETGRLADQMTLGVIRKHFLLYFDGGAKNNGQRAGC